MKRLLFVGAIVLVMFIGMATATEPVKLKFASFAPPKAVSNTITFGPWIDRMNAEGTVKIEKYLGGVLGRDPKLQLKILTDNVSDISFFPPEWIAGQFPDDSVFNLPLMAKNAFESCSGSSALFNKGLLRGYDDIKVLASLTTGTKYIHSSYPIRNPADIKGHKFGVSNKFQADIFRNLGGIGVFMPPSKMAENMSRGVIHGVLIDVSSLFAFRVNDVAKHHLMLPSGNTRVVVAMNKKVYANLPPAAKATIDKHGGEPLRRTWSKMIDDQEEEKLAVLEKDPQHTVVKPTAEELNQWNASLQVLIDDWEKEDPKRTILRKAYEEELDRIR